MNMKTLIVLILIGMSYTAMAQTNSDQPQNTSGQNSRGNNRDNRDEIAKTCATMQTHQGGMLNGTSDIVAVGDIQPNDVAVNVKNCRVLIALSQSVQANVGDRQETTVSVKKDFLCTKAAGYTLDYPYCMKAMNALNVVSNAESAMTLEQQVRTQYKNKNIADQAAKQAASGDVQSVAFDATIESNKFMKGIEGEKAMAYSAAVAALGTSYYNWPKPEKLIETKCTEAVARIQSLIVSAKPTSPPPPSMDDCKKVTGEYNTINNTSSRAALALKITEYIAKGVAAGIKMNQYDTSAKTVEAAKAAVTSEDADAMMERCVFNPTDPLCATPGSRVSGQGYSGGDFALGGGGNNSFDAGAGNTEFGVDGDPSTISNDTVAAASSPFENEAKAANDILNPAAAASNAMGSNQPNNGNSGGVGGGGGGGSAALGNDLNSANKDANKDPTLKTSKSSGNYASAGGGGFSAIKNGKEDANPFASLFDSKSTGGIEEDRSIASDDGGPASGLFQKISKRYSQIQADKRIEANNVE